MFFMSLLKKIFSKRTKKYLVTKNEYIGYNSIRSVEKHKLSCFAPFHSLTFLPTGKVLACCYNTRYILGQYPQDSISEIWFGDKLKRLQKSIKKLNFDCGCEDCFIELKQKNYYSVGAWNYDYLQTNHKNKYPSSFEFQLSNICNLECLMCSGELSSQIRLNREKKKPIANIYNNEFVEQLRNFIPHLKEASFTGGEPFLNPLYYKIWDIIYELNPSCKISVSTNGTILNDNIKSYMSKLRFNFSISINSVDEEVYIKVQKGGNLSSVLDNLFFFKKYCEENHTNLLVKICPLRQNIYSIHKTVEFFNKNDIYISFNKVIFPPYCTLWNLPFDELKNIVDFMEQNAPKGESQVASMNLAKYNTLINLLIGWRDRAEKNSSYPRDVEEMKNILIKNASDFILETKSHDDILVKSKIIDLFDFINENNINVEYIQFLTLMPIENLISALEHREIGQLYERIIQASNEDLWQ